MAVKVLSGIDRLECMDRVLKDKRLAIVTGGGAVDRNLTPVLDILVTRYHVVKLFNTIYGVRGDFRYGEEIPHYQLFAFFHQRILLHYRFFNYTKEENNLQVKCYILLLFVGFGRLFLIDFPPDC